MSIRAYTIIAGWLTACLCMTTVGCGNLSVETPSFYIAPQSDYSVLYDVTDSLPRPIQALKFPGMPDLSRDGPRKSTIEDSLRALAGRWDRITYNSRGWITFVSNEGTRIIVLRYEGGPMANELPVLYLPDGYKAHTSAIVEDVLYVGGACGNEVIGLFDLSSPKPAWKALEVPEELKKDGKRIDDILVHGNRLIAVDDVVFPKYLLLYDVSEPRLPRLIETRMIPNHGVYEGIRKAAVGRNWMVALSMTSGRMSLSQHIALFDVDNLEENGCISNSKRAMRFTGYAGLAADTTVTWESIEFLDDLLIIACRDRGVGLLDLSEIGFFGNFTEQCKEKLKYRWPTVLPQGEVLNVIKVPRSETCLVIMNAGGEFKSFMLSKEEFLR